MRSKFLLFAFLLFTSIGLSQTVDVTGTVLDSSTGEVLVGTNIFIKNSQTGISTDIDGNFKITGVPVGSTIVFTYLGYKDFEYKVSKSESITVKLVETAQALNEIVVLGYSSQKKRDVTGAVTVITGKTIDDLKPIKVEQALQGTVSGVVVTQQSGAPGAGLDIKIRGVATNGSTGPYVIIDGYQGDLSILNPDDIESITVLKDAQAAIYGTLGANGVVVVTTKSGKRNTKTKVSYSGYTGFQETSKKLNLLNATEYALLLNESYANGGQSLPYPNVSGLGTGTDWQNQIFNKAPMISNEFSFSGGSDKMAYSFSASDLYQQGIIGKGKSDFKRNTARLSLNADLSEKIKFQTNLIYTYLDRDSFNDSGLGSVLFNAINTPSTLSVYDTNGNYTLVPSTPGYGIEIINPLAQLDNTFNDYKLKKLNGSVRFDYDLINHLKLTGRMGFNTSNSDGKSFAKEVSYGGKVFDVTRSSVSQNKINDNSYTFDFFAEYNNTFGENHKIKATVGTTVYKEYGSGLFGTGYDVPNNSWEYADLSLATGTGGDGVRDTYSYAYDERRLSFFGFFEYAFNGKYLLTGALRRDLSTKFGPENRVAIFPSFTAGWVVSDENFFKQTKALNFLKLRASYGVLGNDQIRNNGYVGSLSGEATYVINGSVVNGTAVGVLPNPKLQWEEAKKFDIGVDLKMFDEKVSITSDYFSETRDNLLIGNIPVSGITGVYAPGSGSPTINAGAVRNRGLEFAINYEDKISESMKFKVGYNVTTIDNEVLEVNNSTGYLEGGSFGVGQLYPVRMEAGQPMGYFYGYQTDGIFQNQAEIDAHPSQAALGAATSPGDIRYKDLNNDGVINQNDRTNIGDPIANVTMGFNFTFNYKNLDLTSYSYASLGNDMIRNYERTLSDVNRLNYVLDRWTGEGTSNSVPRVTTAATNNNVLSDYFVEDASFLRIQNIQLGYSFSDNLINKVGLTKLRLYTSVNNVYTFTKYRGFDPAATNGSPIGGGIDYGFYPTPRTFILGINANF
ncbi:SusC/RagA family TonB-linked outer membrane protein [Flavobacterium celericrescens]|uniref:TonB-dependent receptor n=1 Tax=Flavobacterium celericrescens TaxID=2709780 RepID=A0ABX0IAL7_9FLAO|nr:TonB-dependent receptor [Flavobacterium celericrescens]NHM04176.1 TonB-dependent receptor [Flavobacterium celericrescens]